MESTLEYVWLKVLADGKSFISQFDLQTGEQNRWYDDNVPLSKLVLTPLSQDLAEKISKACHISAVSNPSLLPYVVNLLPDSEVTCSWNNGFNQTSHMECSVCGQSWRHDDSSKFYECPNCGTTDIWYCEQRHSSEPLSVEILEEKAKKDSVFAGRIDSLVKDFREKKIQFEEYQAKVIELRTMYARWAILNGIFSVVDQKSVVKEKDGKIFCPECKDKRTYGLSRLFMIKKVGDMIPFVDYNITVTGKAQILVKGREVEINILDTPKTEEPEIEDPKE